MKAFYRERDNLPPAQQHIFTRHQRMLSQQKKVTSRGTVVIVDRTESMFNINADIRGIK